MLRMIQVQNATEAYDSTLELLDGAGVKLKTRGMDVIEVSPHYIILKNPLDNMIVNYERNWKSHLARAEFDWYMSGSNLVEDIVKSLPNWRNFSDDGVHVNSSYGYIWKDQVTGLINKFKEDPYTRQGVITIYDGKKYLYYNGKDTICTISLQFKLNNNCLDMFVNMRSNDIVWGFCNDQYCFSMFQKYIADLLGYPVGDYHHFTGSMHIYERHWKFLKNKGK